MSPISMNMSTAPSGYLGCEAGRRAGTILSDERIHVAGRDAFCAPNAVAKLAAV
jgi:hypothetical protein